MAQARRRAAAASGEKKATQRVVIEKVRVVVLPEDDGGRPGDFTDGPVEEAWIERGVFAGEKMEQAIEAFAGKPGTPEAKVGTWKAIPTTNWKGGVRHSAPPLPLVQRERIS